MVLNLFNMAPTKRILYLPDARALLTPSLTAVKSLKKVTNELLTAFFSQEFGTSTFTKLFNRTSHLIHPNNTRTTCGFWQILLYRNCSNWAESVHFL